MIDEKRAFPRKAVSLSTNIFDVETNAVLGECILTDVSKNGFAIESEVVLSIGQKFGLKFTILNKDILLTGEVVRVDNGFFFILYGSRIVDDFCENLDFFRKYIDYSLV